MAKRRDIQKESAMSSEYYENNKEKWLSYQHKIWICPFYNHFMDKGTRCRVKHLCARDDKGNYPEICKI